MSLVFAGICSHGPGITGRPEMADPEVRDEFYANLDHMRQAIEDSGADALVVVASEHFANFFMDNMPAFAIGMADYYDGPFEDEKWLRIPRTRVPGHKEFSRRLIESVLQDVDVAYAEELKLDHGIMVPLNFLTPRYDLPVIPAIINCQGPPLPPLHRAWAFGEALRRAADAAPERIALVATGGLSHWPATPDSGKINEAWAYNFLDRWAHHDRDALCAYTDEETYHDAGQGGFEIRTLIAAAAAAGGRGNVWFAKPIPAFATMAFTASLEIA